KTSSLPPSSGCGGLTITASWSRSGTSIQSSSRRPTTASRRLKPPRWYSRNELSGEPGAVHRSPGAPPGSRGLSHRDPHPEGGEVRSLLSALHSSARAAPAHPTTLSSPSPLLRSSGPHQLTPVRCPGKSDALYPPLENRLFSRYRHHVDPRRPPGGDRELRGHKVLGLIIRCRAE